MNEKEIYGLGEYLKANGWENSDKVVKYFMNLKRKNKMLEEERDISNADYDNLYYYFLQINTILETELIEESIEKIQCLQKENEQLKGALTNNSKINVSDHKYASEMEDKYLTEHNIITQFEKWLEEKTDKAIGTEYSIFVDCLEKLQELKGKYKYE